MGGAGANVKDAAHINPGGEWRTAKTWQPAGAVKYKLYLTASRTLEGKPKGSGKPIAYRFDPDHPNPTLGGRNGPACIVNQIVERADVISFMGAPLSKPLDATGPVRVGLRVSSDRPSADFTARLIDVYPSGYAMNLAEGQIRVESLNPRITLGITLDLGSASNLFEKGHRIRLDISSSSFPRLEPNPGTGETGMWTNRVTATNSLHFGGKFPACMELTVLPD